MDISVSSGKGDSESKKDGHLIADLNVPDSEQHSVISDDTNSIADVNAPNLEKAGDGKVNLDTDEQENINMKLESEEDDETNAHGEMFEDSPLSKSVDFMFETKYVMLNFMSLIPPDMYRGHVSTSPEVEPEFSQKFAKRKTHLSKSKSFDISSYSRKPQLKYIGKLKSKHKRMDSPASEDNLNYRYKKNLKPIESPGCDRFNSDPCTPPAVSELFEQSHSAHELSSHSSPSTSPQKNFNSPLRLFSDASSCGELSFMSDADDEYEEHSNASSIFSSRSISSRDGFLDLRRPFRGVHILSTLQSQSEDKDEDDGLILRHIEDDADNVDLETLPEEVKDEIEKESIKDLAAKVPRDVVDAEGKSRLKQTADRSKLKLNIPCESVQLDDILLSLHSELSSEMDEMESEFEEALHSARSRMSRSSNITPLTPQTEAARILARIGDEVKEQYGARLAAAVNQLTYEQINSLSYTQFRDIAQSVVTAEVPGWRQVALLMVFGQKIIWGAVQHGQRHFGNVIDYCAQFVAENAAEFIIKQGGWSSVMNFDPSSDAQSSAEFDTSPEMVVDYFTSHDVTKVESDKCIDNVPGGANESPPGFNEDNIEVEKTDQIFENKPDMRQNQGLKISSTDKPRYASSVGFEYTDAIEDMAGEDIESDSETDVNVAFDQTVDTEGNVEDTIEENVDVTFQSEDELKDGSENSFTKDSMEGTSVSENPVKGDFQEETIDGSISGDNNGAATKIDLISENVIGKTNERGYDKDSVYVRQATPSAILFDSIVDDLNEGKDVNGNTSEKQEENGLNSKDMRNDKTDKGDERGDIVDVTGIMKGNDEIAENASKGILHLKIDSDDNESVIDNISKYLQDSELVNKVNKSERNENTNKNAQTEFAADAEQVRYEGDLKNSDRSNKNNNQLSNERDIFIEVVKEPHNYQDFQYESDIESAEIESSVEREMAEDSEPSNIEEMEESRISETETIQESHVPFTMKVIGFRVAALAIALLAVGISVRYSILNR